jgi:arylsulfotransferase ASST
MSVQPNSLEQDVRRAKPRGQRGMAAKLACRIAVVSVASIAAASFVIASGALSCSEYGTIVGGDAGLNVQDSRVNAATARTSTPYLQALTVSSSSTPAGAAPVELVPSFSPHVFDYYVRCPSVTNTLTVSMSAASGASSALLFPTSSPATRKQTLSLSVDANQAIVATAIAGSATTEYWVRCLPPDFPALSMVAHPEAGTPTPGYYLVGNSGNTPGYAMVLNGDGVPVWYVESTMAGVDDVDNVVNGGISFFYTWWTTDPLAVRTLDPPTTTHPTPSQAELDSHELRVLPNGHYLALSYPLVTGVNLTGTSDIDLSDAGVAGAQMFDCEVVEFDPVTGDVAWTWTASDHFDPVAAAVAGAIAVQAGIYAFDPYHCNSIDVDPANGNLLISARNMSSIFYVDRSTGAVVWKMGGSVSSKDNATYVSISDPFVQQHDARLQPGWSATTGMGQISVFDDQSNTKAPARGLLLDVTTGVLGTTPMATVAWQYATKASSFDRGSFRISADGSYVIGWGTNVPGFVFTEVDARGHDLLDFYFTDGDESYRAIKVPLDAFDLGVLRKTAGLP